jgi:non-specific serine/threonine protein kinase
MGSEGAAAYVAAADEERAAAREEPMSLAAFVERAFEDPSVAAHAAKYLVDAVEAAGTRTVVEAGEERERYRFFDDPHNDGEHAVLGNTDALNGLVDDLRAAAADRGNAESILWLAGPTATGKSELKRCLIAGLRAYSKTEAGRRYTVEFNPTGASEDPGLTYGGSGGDETAWVRSPVRTNPLAVFPEGVRDDLLADLNAEHDGPPVRADADLDPFSRAAYADIEEAYGRKDKPFSRATAPDHLRVRNYVVEEGQGVGVLHAEDTGTPKERLVGTWMGEVLRDLRSRGRKDPRAFSFDGVLSQGNGGITVVEDAAQHADLLRKLLNVPDERAVKLDKGIGMDLDTQLLIISNPDLEAQLDQHADKQGRDPLKALKRRLRRHTFGYLTTLSLEATLLRRELGLDDAPLRAAHTVTVRKSAGAVERELAPHTVAAAALYDVVTRLDGADLPEDLSLVEKALLFEQGYLGDGDERRSFEEFDLGDGADGENGIPVTYTRDALADAIHGGAERNHPDLAVESVLTPADALNAMADGLAEAPVFSSAERDAFEDRVAEVKAAVLDWQEADVLDAMLAGEGADEASVAAYVEHVYAWVGDGEVETERGTAEPDPLRMQVFETEHLGFDEGDYDGTEPGEAVADAREHTVSALTRHAWANRTEDFRAADVAAREVPELRAALEANDWDAVERAYPDFDPAAWGDPPANTTTAALKAKTIDNMTENGYSPASAELASARVLREVQGRWG